MAVVEQSINYKIRTTILNNNDGSAIDISKNVKNIMIKRDYINNVFPLFVLNMTLTEEERDLLRDNDADISLKVYSGNALLGSQDEESDMNDYLSEVSIDTILRVYDKKFTTDSLNIDENEDDIDESNGTIGAPSLFYSIACIPKDIADSNSFHINNIYDNCKAPTALLNIVSSMNINKDVYFDSIDLSPEQYNFILITPQTPMSAISYLDDNYKIYTNGVLNAFHDIDKIYLYNIYNNKVKD